MFIGSIALCRETIGHNVAMSVADKGEVARDGEKAEVTASPWCRTP
jgi:hypothetical protein